MKNSLEPTNKIETKGRLAYHEAARAYNTIRLPRQLIDQFPELRNRLLKITFKIRFFRHYSDLKRCIWELEYSNEIPPLLLSLHLKNEEH